MPISFLLAGALFVTSAVSSGGTDIRPDRYQDLPDLIDSQAAELEQLRAEAAEIGADIDALSDVGSGKGAVRKAQRRVQEARAAAGLEPVVGSAVTITLTDAPEEVRESVGEDADVTINDLIVHQQDIQAVVNTLWAGGATAMTIQGQRVVSTTGIKCVGNTVILHDVPYAPPYVITAVGPTDNMTSAVAGSNYIAAYLEVVDAYQLGWELEVEPSVELPGYEGPTELRYARPVTTSATDADAR